MTIKLIFDITLTIIIIYIFFIYNVEHATDVSDNKTEGSTTGQSNTQFSDQQKKDITNIINDLYMTDVDAIRNLSDVATKLQTQDKLILPGQLNVQGKLATNGLNPSDMPDKWTGGLRFIDGYASGNMGFGPNATTINAQIDNGGNIMGKNLNLNGKIVTNDLTFNNSFTSGNMSFGPNATTINARINKDGDIDGNNLNLKGNLKVNNVLTTKNRARYIRVGNKMTPSTIINNLDGSTNTDVSPLAIDNLDGSTNTDVSPLANDNWHLIEIKVLSSGLNVANNATVTPVGEITDNNNKKYDTNTSYANITNGIIFGNTQTDNIIHGYRGGKGRHLLEIDLTKEYDIDAIELYSRYSGNTANEMNGTIVELISGDKLTINRRIHTGIWHRTYSKEYILN